MPTDESHLDPKIDRPPVPLPLAEGRARWANVEATATKIPAHLNFLVGDPTKSSTKLLSLIAELPRELFKTPFDINAFPIMHGCLKARFQPALLEQARWKCEAHEQPRQAHDLYFHFFQAITPPHYLHGRPVVRSHAELAITLASMVYCFTIGKQMRPHNLVERATHWLEDFGAYAPHLHCIAIPVCSVENKTCMLAAKETVSEVINNLMMSDPITWALSRPYTSAAGKAICQRCGETKDIKMCAKKCGFG